MTLRRSQTAIGFAALVLLLIALFLISIGSAEAQAAAEIQLYTLEHDDLTRTYHLYVPAALESAAGAPLLVALHPFSSSGLGMAAVSRLNGLAEAEGVVVVYPNAVDLNWNEGRQTAGRSLALPAADDSGFILALIDHLAETQGIDPAQVFLTGFSSSGGPLAYLLACQSPGRFAAVAVVGALPWRYTFDACGVPADEASTPVRLLAVVGTDDVFYPPEGQVAEGVPEENAEDTPFYTLSVAETLAAWAVRNGCDADAIEASVDAGVYTACEDTATVAAYVIQGVGNNWPVVDGDATLNQFGIDLNAVLARFFLGDVGDDGGESWRALAEAQTSAGEIFEGIPRTYRVYVPTTYDPAEPIPVVTLLHGRPDNGFGIAYLADANRIAEEQGFILVYPDGLEQSWNYSAGVPGYYDTGVDDSTFLARLMTQLELDLNIDRDRLYLMGFSNGGFMTQRAACETADTFAAYGIIGAGLFPPFIDLCEGAPPVPMVFMHGTRDISINWGGVRQGEVVITMPLPQTIQFWGMRNGCPGDSEQFDYDPQGSAPVTFVNRYTFTGCTAADIMFYVIVNGGHNLPGVPDRLNPQIAGSVNTDIHAVEVYWDFFQDHPMRARSQ